ncbi:hypothetical protein [Paenibacillus endoradicis]|uniref:hypothetical protein n=1 Tax=Paenibacillus endoradicis TaxID=2972487 RepID=UPI002159A5C2|nr:hypothetical protein [Paenibacillus endoradicis]MCR8659214.1 hypothetical protein [Paenibacillus endoradicis]
MSQQVSEKQVEPTGKKSIAFAVTLVLLVASIMLNVLFSTKNMSYGQDQKADSGEHIFQHLASFNEKNTLLIKYVYDIVDFSPENSKLARLTAAHALPLVGEMKKELSELITIAQDFDEVAFSTQDKDNHEWYKLIEEQLQLIANQEGELSQAELDELNAMIEGSEYLAQTVNSFNFKVEGNKNAMIRLGNGFDWIEQVQAIELYVNIEGVQ